MKSADTGNGVTFRSGDNVDLGPSHIAVSFIDTAMQMVSVPSASFTQDSHQDSESQQDEVNPSLLKVRKDPSVSKYFVFFIG